MQFLYKAYSCEDVDGSGKGKALMPGFSAHLSYDVRCGDMLHVEFADGTWLVTQVVGMEQIHLDDETARRFFVSNNESHQILRVSGELNYPLLAQGALVYLDMSRSSRFSHVAEEHPLALEASQSV